MSIVFGQGKIIEPQYIRDLQSKLSWVKDTERIDLLNKIAFSWQQMVDTTKEWAQVAKIKHDSMAAYATMAYNGSVKLNYEKGKGIALVNLAHSKYFTWFGKRGHPKKVEPSLLDSMELLLTKAQPVIEKTNDIVSGLNTIYSEVL
jgi:hypothetical protein